MIFIARQASAIENNQHVNIIESHPNEVIPLTGTNFFTTDIEFEKKEAIQAIYIGDQVAWTYSFGTALPALFMLEEGKEKLVNIESYPNLIIAKRIAKAFVLVRGND
jgi:type IV secretory pathway VirB9-like protein